MGVANRALSIYGASTISQINAQAQHNKSPVYAMIYGISTEISWISRKISGFPGFHERFQDFTDFTKDFRISTEISGFRERFLISREISGEVYEISVSGGPSDIYTYAEISCPPRRSIDI